MEDNKINMLDDDKLVEVSGGDFEHMEIKFRCTKNGVEGGRVLRAGFDKKFSGDNEEFARACVDGWCEVNGYELIEYLGYRIV